MAGSNTNHFAWSIALVSYMSFCDGHFLCRTTQTGVDYSGSLNEAVNGKSCLHWSDVLNSSDIKEFLHHIPENDTDSAENFCRNPTNEADGPWCFTSDVATERCNVPYYAPHKVHCKTSMLGKEYNGELNFTKTGKVCQRWDSQFPHNHTRNNPIHFPDSTLDEATNFCRNPDGEQEGPWCYTVNPDKRWEYCDISFCNESVEVTNIIPMEHKIPSASLTDGDLESCQRLYSPSATDFKFLINMTSTWEKVNVEIAFNSEEVRSCKDSLFFAYHTETDKKCSSTCESLTLCQWVEISTAMEKEFCRFTCSCRNSCQSVTLTVPSQLAGFELCEVSAWSW